MEKVKRHHKLLTDTILKAAKAGRYGDRRGGKGLSLLVRDTPSEGEVKAGIREYGSTGSCMTLASALIRKFPCTWPGKRPGKMPCVPPEAKIS